MHNCTTPHYILHYTPLCNGQPNNLDDNLSIGYDALLHFFFLWHGQQSEPKLLGNNYTTQIITILLTILAFDWIPPPSNTLPPILSV